MHEKELYDRYNMILEELKFLEEEKNRILEDIRSLKNNILIIEEISKEKKLDEVFFPIFNGVYMKTKILDKDNFFMLSSNKYAIIENKDEIKVKINQNIKNLDDVIIKLNKLISNKKMLLFDIEDSME